MSKYRKILVGLLVAGLFASFAACGSSDNSDEGDAAVSIPEGPIQVVQTVEAVTKDGVLFDIKLSLPVFDYNDSGSRRDDVEVITPDKTEYQGIFSDGPGTLLIVSCFADACQGDSKYATFEVHYWVESLPDPIPEGVDFIGG